MGTYAKKTLTGYRPLDGDAAADEATHFIMTAEEMNSMQAELRKANRDIKTMQKLLKERVEQAYNDARAQLQEHKDAFEEQKKELQASYEGRLAEKETSVRQLTAQLDRANVELTNERDLQKNLLRIMRERSNQKRGITPKKEHDGYIVLDSSQFTEKTKRDEWASNIDTSKYTSAENRAYAIKHGLLTVITVEISVWRSTLQTPYDAALPLEDIQNKVEKDLWEGGVLKSIGCPGMMVPEENGKYHYFGKTEDGTEKNGLYRWRFRANFRSGQWELELYTTRGLRVPEERMPGGTSGSVKKRELAQNDS